MRKCSKCKEKMIEGFYIAGFTDEYYCTEKCLYTVYTEQQWLDMYDDEEIDCYWTQWEEDEE